MNRAPLARVALPGALCLAFVVALGLGPLRADERPAEPKSKVKRSRVEEMVGRAYHKCKGADGLTLTRVTIAPNDDTTMMIAEYATGDVGLFVGDDDPANDCFGVVSQKNVALVREALQRSATPR